MDPLLKVKYSKKAIADQLSAQIPAGTRTVVDLAVTDLFWLTQGSWPARKTINCTNPDTHLVYQAVKESPSEFIEHCRNLWEDTSKEEYLSLLMSDQSTGTLAENAAIKYYLNQLSTPGAHRYNKATKLQETNITYWAEQLAKAKLTQQAPAQLLEELKPTATAIIDLDGVDNPEELLAIAAETNKNLIAVSMNLYEDHQPTPGIKNRPGSKTPDWVYSITTNP